jgi:hypothetical protein
MHGYGLFKTSFFYNYEVSTKVTNSHPHTRKSTVVCWLIILAFVNGTDQDKKNFCVQSYLVQTFLCVACDNMIHLVWTITTRCLVQRVVARLSCPLLYRCIRHAVLSCVLQSPIPHRIQKYGLVYY